jgi:hypothetical protein
MSIFQRAALFFQTQITSGPFFLQDKQEHMATCECISIRELFVLVLGGLNGVEPIQTASRAHYLFFILTCLHNISWKPEQEAQGPHNESHKREKRLLKVPRALLFLSQSDPFTRSLPARQQRPRFSEPPREPATSAPSASRPQTAATWSLSTGPRALRPGAASEAPPVLRPVPVALHGYFTSVEADSEDL